MRRTSRRRYLGALGTGVVSALAGCSGSSDGVDDGENGAGGDDDGGNGGDDGADRGSDGGGNGEAGASAPGAWTAFRGDPARTGRVPADASPGDSIDVAWTAGPNDLVADDDPVGVSYTSSPVCTDELVLWISGYYHEGNRLRLFAADAASGEIEWTAATDRSEDEGWLQVEPTVIDDRVYVPGTTDDGARLLAFDLDSGQLEAELPYPGSGYPPAFADERGYVFDDGSIVAIDLDDGAERWDLPAQLHPDSRPTVTDRVWWFDGSGELVAVDGGEERVRRAVEVEDRMLDAPARLTSPVIAGGGGYAAGNVGAFDDGSEAPLVAFDDDGTERWRYRPADVDARDVFDLDDVDERVPFAAVYGLPLVVDGLVVTSGYGAPEEGGTGGVAGGDEHTHLFAVDETEGTLEWAIEAPFGYAPVAAGGVIYHVSSRGVDVVSTDGERLDSVELQDLAPQALASPAIAHGRLYVPLADRIVALA